MVAQYPTGTAGDADDIASATAPPTSQQGAAPAASGGTSQTSAGGSRARFGEFAVFEVAGDPVVAPTPALGGEAAGAGFDEVGNVGGGEAAGEVIEASPAQLAAASTGADSAVSDLTTVPGFTPSDAGSESGTIAPALPLREAGSEIDGTGESAQEEFLPILTALAPTLLSTIGPAVAKGVISRLSPRARAAIPRVARPATAILTAARPVLPSAGGTGDLVSLLARLLQSAAAKPSGESAEADPDIVERAAVAMEIILGTDDRIRIERTNEDPWRRVCALRITFPSGAAYRGTGFLIGKRAVATAGHCVYLHNQGGWARSVQVIPGANGSQMPFGQAEATSFRSIVGWVTNRAPESDIGCVVLPTGAFGSSNLGSFGFAAWDSSALLANAAVLAGYPGDKPFAELWGMVRKLKAVTPTTLIYDIDTAGGQSGAQVYIKRDGQRFVVGIHNYGAAGGNSATRVTQAVYQRLLAWSQL